MKKAFINGIINTISNGYAQGFVIENDRIIYVGQTEDCIKLADTLYDLNGHYVLPGFIDAHMHLINYGKFLHNVNLFNTKSILEIQKRLLLYLETNRNTIKWIFARGFNDDSLIEKRLPTKADLDIVSDKIPILIVRCCGHMCICNSKALSLLKTNNYGKHYDLNKGHFYEDSMEIILNRLPKPDKSTYFDYIEEAQNKLFKYGIVAVGSDDLITLSKDYRKAFDILTHMSKCNFLKIKINEQCQFSSLNEYKHFLAREITTGHGNDHFKIGPLKIIQDGSLGSKTAKLTVNYPNSDTNGMEYYTKDELRQFIELAKLHNMSVIVHTIGDKALDTVLDIYEEFIDKDNTYKWGIVHAQITRKDQLIRMIKMHLILYIQSIFIDSDSKIIHDLIFPEIIDTSYIAKSLYKFNLLANGSDAPVEEPNVFKGLKCAISRKSLDNKHTINPQESLTIEEALKTYTINAAIATNFNNELGSIEEGKLASFIILNKDLRKIQIEDLTDVIVEKTFISGKVVYNHYLNGKED